MIKTVLYIVADLHDLEDKQLLSFEGAKDFLIGMWEGWDNEDEEHVQNHINNIQNADPGRLNDFLGGCGYTLFLSWEDYFDFLN